MRLSDSNEEFNNRLKNLNVGLKSESSRQSYVQNSYLCQSKTETDSSSTFNDDSNWTPRSHPSELKFATKNCKTPNCDPSPNDFTRLNRTPSQYFDHPSPVVFTTAPTVPVVVRPVATKPESTFLHFESSPFSTPTTSNKKDLGNVSDETDQRRQKMNFISTLIQQPSSSILRQAEMCESRSDSSRQDPKTGNVRQKFNSSGRTPGDAVGIVSGVGRAELIRRLKEKQFKS